MSSISLQNLSDESSYSHDLSKLNNPNLFNYAEVTLSALTAAASQNAWVPVPTEARGRPPHNTQIRALRTPT